MLNNYNKLYRLLRKNTKNYIKVLIRKIELDDKNLFHIKIKFKQNKMILYNNKIKIIIFKIKMINNSR